MLGTLAKTMQMRWIIYRFKRYIVSDAFLLKRLCALEQTLHKDSDDLLLCVPPEIIGGVQLTESAQKFC